MKVISEEEFYSEIWYSLIVNNNIDCNFITGPGRSGAIASVYASHILHKPFVPYGSFAKGKVLIVDTASMSGRTLRKAASKYRNHDPEIIYFYKEPPRVKFWYEL